MTPNAARRAAGLKALPLARYTATISTTNGWWNRYRVDRLHGFGIPECAYSGHRTLKGAQRAARRWTTRNGTEPVLVERHGFSGIANL